MGTFDNLFTFIWFWCRAKLRFIFWYLSKMLQGFCSFYSILTFLVLFFCWWIGSVPALLCWALFPLVGLLAIFVIIILLQTWLQLLLLLILHFSIIRRHLLVFIILVFLDVLSLEMILYEYLKYVRTLDYFLELFVTELLQLLYDTFVDVETLKVAKRFLYILHL